MEVTVLGCGTNIPNPRKAGPSFYIKDRSDSILLDMGPNSLLNMVRANINRLKIENILFTHFHSDHFSDLVIFLGNRDYEIGLKQINLPKLNIFIPKGYRQIINGLAKFPGIRRILPKARIKDLWNSSLKISGFKVKTLPLSHWKTKEVGVRIEKHSKSIAYTGDTGVCNNLYKLFKDADTAIVECAFPKKMNIAGHLNSGQVGKVAQKAGAKTLVLTHIYPFAPDSQIKKEVQENFKGKVILARDLLRIKV